MMPPSLAATVASSSISLGVVDSAVLTSSFSSFTSDSFCSLFFSEFHFQLPGECGFSCVGSSTEGIMARFFFEFPIVLSDQKLFS